MHLVGLWSQVLAPPPKLGVLAQRLVFGHLVAAVHTLSARATAYGLRPTAFLGEDKARQGKVRQGKARQAAAAQ